MRVFLIFIAMMLATLSPGHADKRVALVIGNAGYQHTAPLANPLNDAADVSAALKKLGFQVIEGRDLDKLGMDRLILQFARALTGADAGVLFYAGHGLQVDGQNFLVPIDAKLENAAGLEFETVRLDAVHRTMERATRTNILFLDACRDNPLSRNLARALGTRSATIGRGLAVVESGEGTLISFSTQPGNVALDGTGRNSPYATALVRQLDKPKEDISSLLIGVRNEVIRETRRKQVPWEHSALTARFFFTPPEPDKPMAAPVPQPVGPSYAQQAELAFWSAIKDSRDPGVIQTYLDAYPQGTFAALARVLVDRTKAESDRAQDLRAAETAGREAEGRKQADEVKRLQEEARKAREALAKAESERQEAVKEAEAARQAQEEAAQRAVGSTPGGQTGGDFVRDIKPEVLLDFLKKAPLKFLDSHDKIKWDWVGSSSNRKALGKNFLSSLLPDSVVAEGSFIAVHHKGGRNTEIEGLAAIVTRKEDGVASIFLLQMHGTERSRKDVDGRDRLYQTIQVQQTNQGLRCVGTRWQPLLATSEPIRFTELCRFGE